MGGREGRHHRQLLETRGVQAFLEDGQPKPRAVLHKKLNGVSINNDTEPKIL